MSKKVNTPRNLAESTDLLKRVTEGLKNGEITIKESNLLSRASRGQINCYIANIKRSLQVEKEGGKILPKGDFYDSELQTLFLSYGELFAKIMNNEIAFKYATEALKLIDIQLAAYEINKNIKGKVPSRN